MEDKSSSSINWTVAHVCPRPTRHFTLSFIVLVVFVANVKSIIYITKKSKKIDRIYIKLLIVTSLMEKRAYNCIVRDEARCHQCIRFILFSISWSIWSFEIRRRVFK